MDFLHCLLKAFVWYSAISFFGQLNIQTSTMNIMVFLEEVPRMPLLAISDTVILILSSVSNCWCLILYIGVPLPPAGRRGNLLDWLSLVHCRKKMVEITIRALWQSLTNVQHSQLGCSHPLNLPLQHSQLGCSHPLNLHATLLSQCAICSRCLNGCVSLVHEAIFLYHKL